MRIQCVELSELLEIYDSVLDEIPVGDMDGFRERVLQVLLTAPMAKPENEKAFFDLVSLSILHPFDQDLPTPNPLAAYSKQVTTAIASMAGSGVSFEWMDGVRFVFLKVTGLDRIPVKMKRAHRRSWLACWTILQKFVSAGYAQKVCYNSKILWQIHTTPVAKIDFSIEQQILFTDQLWKLAKGKRQSEYSLSHEVVGRLLYGVHLRPVVHANKHFYANRADVEAQDRRGNTYFVAESSIDLAMAEIEVFVRSIISSGLGAVTIASHLPWKVILDTQDKDPKIVFVFSMQEIYKKIGNRFLAGEKWDGRQWIATSGAVKVVLSFPDVCESNNSVVEAKVISLYPMENSTFSKIMKRPIPMISLKEVVKGVSG